MANSKDIVTKTDQTNLFTTNVTNLVHNASVWYSGSPSLPSNMVGFPTSYLAPRNPGGPIPAELSDAAINATVLASALQSWCLNYTRIRRFRFQRTGNLAPYDSTQLTSMTTSFIQSGAATDINNTASQSGIAKGQIVSAASFNNFISQLYSKWDAYKNNTVTYTYNYCHSSCHSACHSSTRIRR